MILRDFIEPIRLFGSATTLAEVMPELEAGRPLFLRLTEGLFALTARAAVGYPPTRRLIDLPLVEVPVLDPDFGVERVFASEAALLAVADFRGLLGYVDRSRILESLASQEDPESLGPLLLARMMPTLVHDLANSLLVVDCAVGRLVEEGAAEAVGAQAALAHAISLLSRARDLTQGRHEGPPGPVDLIGCVEGLRDALQTALGPGVRLEIAPAPSRPTVLAYARVIERTLLNLALNSRDASRGTGVLRVGIDDADPEVVVLQVDDDGPGIPANIQANLFHAGVSTHADSARGLGLASVSQALRRIGASIEVAPPALGGASFRVRLARASWAS